MKHLRPLIFISLVLVALFLLSSCGLIGKAEQLERQLQEAEELENASRDHRRNAFDSQQFSFLSFEAPDDWLAELLDRPDRPEMHFYASGKSGDGSEGFLQVVTYPYGKTDTASEEVREIHRSGDVRELRAHLTEMIKVFARDLDYAVDEASMVASKVADDTAMLFAYSDLRNPDNPDDITFGVAGATGSGIYYVLFSYPADAEAELNMFDRLLSSLRDTDAAGTQAMREPQETAQELDATQEQEMPTVFPPTDDTAETGTQAAAEPPVTDTDALIEQTFNDLKFSLPASWVRDDLERHYNMDQVTFYMSGVIGDANPGNLHIIYYHYDIEAPDMSWLQAGPYAPDQQTRFDYLEYTIEYYAERMGFEIAENRQKLMALEHEAMIYVFYSDPADATRYDKMYGITGYTDKGMYFVTYAYVPDPELEKQYLRNFLESLSTTP